MSDKIEKLRFRSYPVLPLVYDDSLSYYEVLGKVTKKINEVIEEVGTLDTERMIPAGGNAGQVLAKRSGTNYDTAWVDQQGGSAGVSSFNGRTGAVNPQTGDYNVNMINGAVSETDLQDPSYVASLNLWNKTSLNPTNKTVSMTQAVGLDANGKLWTAPTGGGGGVTTFNGRTGDVLPESGDYSATDITGLDTFVDEEIKVELGIDQIDDIVVYPNLVPKTDAMTQEVGYDEQGRLWTAPSGGTAGGIETAESVNITSWGTYIKTDKVYICTGSSSTGGLSVALEDYTPDVTKCYEYKILWKAGTVGKGIVFSQRASVPTINWGDTADVFVNNNHIYEINVKIYANTAYIMAKDWGEWSAV